MSSKDPLASFRAFPTATWHPPASAVGGNAGDDVKQLTINTYELFIADRPAGTSFCSDIGQRMTYEEINVWPEENGTAKADIVLRLEVTKGGRSFRRLFLYHVDCGTTKA